MPEIDAYGDRVVNANLAGALDAATDSVDARDSGSPTLLSSSGSVKSGSGYLRGFYVSSTSSGTIVLYDNTAGSGTAMSGTITPAVGFHRFPAKFATGCYAVLANTISVTFFSD